MILYLFTNLNAAAEAPIAKPRLLEDYGGEQGDQRFQDFGTKAVTSEITHFNKEKFLSPDTRAQVYENLTRKLGSVRKLIAIQTNSNHPNQFGIQRKLPQRGLYRRYMHSHSPINHEKYEVTKDHAKTLMQYGLMHLKSQDLSSRPLLTQWNHPDFSKPQSFTVDINDKYRILYSLTCGEEVPYGIYTAEKADGLYQKINYRDREGVSLLLEENTPAEYCGRCRDLLAQDLITPLRALFQVNIDGSWIDLSAIYTVFEVDEEHKDPQSTDYITDRSIESLNHTGMLLSHTPMGSTLDTLKAHMLSLFDDLTEENKVDRYIEIRYLLAHIMEYTRGSAAISEWKGQIFAKTIFALTDHSIEREESGHHLFDVDQNALALPFDEFSEQYKKFLEPRHSFIIDLR